MTHLEPREQPIGFVTAIELAEIGWCGGLLLLNERGRPLEFHCNVPIRPSRTQEILCGASLRQLILADAIALPLVEKVMEKMAAVLTDLPDLWSIAPHVPLPVMGVFSAETEGCPVDSQRGATWIPREIEGQTIWVLRQGTDLESSVGESVIRFAQRLPLLEPFDRIRQAISEAHQTAQWRESA